MKYNSSMKTLEVLWVDAPKVTNMTFMTNESLVTYRYDSEKFEIDKHTFLYKFKKVEEHDI